MCWSENMWKKLHGRPEDDRYYLICWLTSENEYSIPHRAYYCKEEDKFFSLENHSSHPLVVDIYCEIPLIPNM
jgi:hypothetical protein